ncbi:patatin-like phospholipase family protein [Luteimonas sp. Y-2-2-4F]|nr:patatin-like phospholipase family protein [Luteimonas sp. Y-2-2-4F]MCD9031965.1 patatin-like phospholipase family protein [Luteimonas sp. Y-2-2-4F]
MAFRPTPAALRRAFLALALPALAACGREHARPEPPPAAPAATAPVAAPPLRIGLALGGGAAKGFAHIGVIKILEANGIEADVVAGTSAGSVVGALYAGGLDAFAMQERAVALDEASIRDVRLFSGGLVQGQKLQDYVNAQVGGRPIERLGKPFAAVATRLDSGDRVVFVRGNTGQAVRASSSVPGVFEPARIGQHAYVDGGVVSPVPVDAARQLGADLVIAVDISTRASGAVPDHLLGIVNQSIAIMGQRLGAEERARAEVVIRPQVDDIGPASFEQRSRAILQGERAALAAMPQIRAAIERRQRERAAALAPRPAQPEPAADEVDCGGTWVRRLNPFRRAADVCG